MMMRTMSGSLVLFGGLVSLAWAADPPPPPPQPTAEQAAAWSAAAEQLVAAAQKYRAAHEDDRHSADVEICGKAVQWVLRHREFPQAKSVAATEAVLKIGQERLKELEADDKQWLNRAGMTTVYGYVSALDDSVQPFAVTLPADFDPQSRKRWPLHLVLHGRDGNLTEVSFIQRHEKAKPKEPLPVIQLDVFGRTNNAYRWAGEADVFEALAATKRLFPIDDQRVTLWGFSMGGAGAWHLGLHHPDEWSSVGAGAGFCDTVVYQQMKEPLSPLHSKLVRIYDAVDYTLNAANVPTVGYGGELDKQLLAAQTMHDKAKTLGVDIALLVGPKTEHKFHPDSWKEFLAFHQRATATGRPVFPAPAKIRFTTCTPKYNQCVWLTLEEQLIPYEPSTVEAAVDEATGVLNVTTKNVAVLQIARDVADAIVIDGGPKLALNSAAGGLLPGVYFEKTAEGWNLWEYRQSHEYITKPSLTKRHNRQGPIDDAFTRAFLCVKGTGKPWSQAHQEYADWNLERFAREYDKWFRAKLPIIEDRQVTEDLMETHNLILFGDPGSNSLIARVVDQLPLSWTKQELSVRGETHSADQRSVPLIYPNPLSPAHYVVLNSGHTFHEAEFKASNAQLYPRLGDIGVVEFVRRPDGSFLEKTVWSEILDGQWNFPHPK